MQRAPHALCRTIGPAITSALRVLAVNLLAAPGVAGSRLREIADLEPVRDDLRVGIGVADAALGEMLNAQEVA